MDVKQFKNCENEDDENFEGNKIESITPHFAKNMYVGGQGMMTSCGGSNKSFNLMEEKSQSNKNSTSTRSKMQYLPLYTHFNTNPAQLVHVPLNGPLKSTSVIMSQQQSLLSYSQNNKNIDSSGMIGSILQVPLSQK